MLIIGNVKNFASWRETDDNCFLPTVTDLALDLVSTFEDKSYLSKLSQKIYIVRVFTDLIEGLIGALILLIVH